jgi:hypothetical protein
LQRAFAGAARLTGPAIVIEQLWLLVGASKSDLDAGLAVLTERATRQANALLLLNLRDRESRADCDCGQDGMPRVARQAQVVRGLPRSDANVGSIFVRALLGEQQLAFLPTFFGFVGQAFGVSSDGLRGEGRCRCLLVHEVLPSGYP